MIFLILTACSSNDDSTTEEKSTEAFIGKWLFGDTVYILKDGGEFVENVSSCEAQSFYRFNTNGSAEITSFIDTGSGCEKEPENLMSFSWQKLSDSSYRLDSTENDGTKSTRNETVIFESNSRMYWQDKFNGVTLNGEEFTERRSYFTKD